MPEREAAWSVRLNHSAIPINDHTEWLEADGLGGFASGTTARVRTRRYHALLLAAARPPADRHVLVSGFVAWVVSPQGEEEIWPQRYAGGFETGRDIVRATYQHEPWPTWLLTTCTGRELRVELFVPHGSPAVVLRFETPASEEPCQLRVRPLFSGRDFHGVHRHNPHFAFEPECRAGVLRFKPYPGIPSILSLSNARFSPAPDWYHHFYYSEEAARGLPDVEDLASPGVLEFALHEGPAHWILKADLAQGFSIFDVEASTLAERLRERESARRASFAGPLDRAADAYLVERGSGHTLIAGYPWFGDWGRDTFIALRGLCLARGQIQTAVMILREWASAVSGGMLPNRFTEQPDREPEYNSVDAALWYVVAANELLETPGLDHELSSHDRSRLSQAILSIVQGYARGTRFNIHQTEDGLLAAGARTLQLTWMDAKVGDWVVTPRVGKPVEIQALWIHALDCAARLDPSYRSSAERARAHFMASFWDESRGCLFDVVDVDHVRGKLDTSLRPNQILAAGGLPVELLDRARARRVVDAVERALWTPLGLRSLAPGEPGYAPYYRGGVLERDGTYHQGTAWPWLLGPFVEAWVKSRGNSASARAEARQRFLTPLLEHLGQAGLGHVSEIADAESPHTPRGCPFQAWSLGELIRLQRRVLADPE